MAFPTADTQVQAAEAELGVRLPEEFRRRLISNNGGDLSTADDDWQLFPVFDATDRKRAARSANHIVRETAQARQSERFPKGAVAIAANGTGDLLVFLRRPGNDGLDGHVYHWSHETGDCEETALDYT